VECEKKRLSFSMTRQLGAFKGMRQFCFDYYKKWSLTTWARVWEPEINPA